MEETWKDIPGYEGRYQVSNYGNVRSVYLLGLGKHVIKKPEVHYSGYLYHKIWDVGNKTRKKLFVHRLVAIAFLPNPEEKPIVNHLDRNRANNNLKNLEWCDGSENQQHWRQDELRKKEAQEPVMAAINPEDIPW
jgi:hypothetical protein